MISLADYYHNLCKGPAVPALPDKFAKYQNELLAWNSQFNLTAIRSPEEIETRHFMDSLSLLPVIQQHKAHSLIDIGSGAGFPGIPLKIADPSLHVVLVESVEKKAAFCRHIIQTLGLENAEVVTERAEGRARRGSPAGAAGISAAVGTLGRDRHRSKEHICG